MKTGWMKVLTVFLLTLGVGVVLLGCGPDKEEVELQKQINQQIQVIDGQVKGLEDHQTKLREMIKEMQGQLDAMQAELDRESPKIVAAGDGLLRLRELTTSGFGINPGEETIEDLSFSYTNILIVTLLVLFVWVLYRMRHRSNNIQS